MITRESLEKEIFGVFGEIAILERMASGRDYAELQTARAVLLLTQATLLASESQVVFTAGGKWSEPVVGDSEVSPASEHTARVRELLGALDNRMAGSGMTEGDLKNFAELKRLILDLLDNPLYQDVEIETAKRAAEIAQVLADYVENQARMAEDRARVGGNTPAETRNLYRAYNQMESAANDVENLARFLLELAQAQVGERGDLTESENAL